MKVSNLKVKTPSIPSRTAASQFIAQHGYDMEWVPEQELFYVHDVEKDKLHVIHLDEVTNFSLDAADPAAFMAMLRKTIAAAGSQLHNAMLTANAKAKPKALVKEAPQASAE